MTVLPKLAVLTECGGPFYDELIDSLDLTPEQATAFREVLPRAKREAHILVSGKSGAGKSKLVNALTGAINALEGDSLDPVSIQLRKYEVGTANGFTVIVWDGPGFFDGFDKNFEYVQHMRDKCRDRVDMLLYCVDMSEQRTDVDQIISEMLLLTEALGQEVWKHAIIVLTFANVVAERIEGNCSNEQEMKIIFLEKIHQWKDKLYCAFEHAKINRDIFEQVLIEPAGDYLTPDLPDRPHWLGYLWLLFLFHSRDEAKLAILLNNSNRLISSEYLQPDQAESPNDPSTVPLIIPENQVTALQKGTIISMSIIGKAAAGEVAGGVVGAVAGGAAGAVIGGIVLGSLTFGVGAAVGVVAGGVAGATVGGICIVLINKKLKKAETAAENTSCQFTGPLDRL